ncbi:LCP family protein [Streptomyces sp. NPDC050844]|uniref:LCP family protein n=1 Tax=Streptomyces sp. NPDC050844 TaxID=3155790 RepID=UPI0033CA2DE6
MGTDGRDTITRREKREFRAGGVACNCTDTLTLVHVSEARDRVEAVGGVQICTQRRLKDPTTKLDLTPGRHRLGGEALQYARSRNVHKAADFGRIRRQQRFLVAVLSSLRTESVLADPARAAQLSRTLLGAGRVDQGFSDG